MIDTTEASSPASGEETEARSAPLDGVAPAPARATRRVVAGGPAPAQPPRIVRPASLPHASHPVEPPAPEHHHLPGWVRRVHGQARPILADLLGNLSGDALVRFQSILDTLIGGMSGGRFSLAWQYPRVINEGMDLLVAQRQENAAQLEAQRALEQRRRKAGEALREAGGRIAPDVIARLSRSLRSATTATEIDAVAEEVGQSLTTARNHEERRRDREIDRTRSRIRKTVPRGAAEPAETWQDVLRRFAESQTAE